MLYSIQQSFIAPSFCCFRKFGVSPTPSYSRRAQKLPLCREPSSGQPRSGTEGKAQALGDSTEMDPLKWKAWQKDWLLHRENVDLSPG